MQKEEEISGTAEQGNNIILSEAQIQLANINTAGVRAGNIGRKLTFTGVLKVNEQSAVSFSSWISGRIEKLYFRNTGERVKKGDMLYEFYSEELVSTQREYLRLQSNNWNFSAKYEPSLAVKEKLVLMGMMPLQIEQLGKGGKLLFTIPIYSPLNGVIRSVNVSEGQYINEGQSLFEFADDNNLWVEAQVYPDEVQFLRPGMPAIVSVPITGEFPVKCNISFVNPSFETGKNITIVRAMIENPVGRLHPGMFALLSVLTGKSHGMIIPSSAVISDNTGDRVWVREESGEFSFRMVTTGMQSGDSTLILSGLETSDKIVTSGAYLLNSEMILKQGPELPAGKELLTLTAKSR
jgi:Cu(I)/Ag(I) efflux system membrane fusion protein